MKIDKETAEKIKEAYNQLDDHKFKLLIDSITEKEIDLVKGLKEIREDHEKDQKIEPLEFHAKDEHLAMMSILIRDKINEVIEWINNQ